MIKTKTIRRRNYRNLVVFGLGIFTAAFLFVFLAQRFGKIEDNTSAANLANFQAGYIISDYQMTDYKSMNESQIQSFLKSKGKCNNTNFKDVGTRVDYFSDSTPPTTWHVKDGHTVCLADEKMNGETAAHIIWQAAQDYKINPKVLIVLIQKETGLITDPIPNSWDYQRTAGYGCPDTAACSEKYYGFKNQIRNAAQLFRIVMDGNSSYYPIGKNNVRYNPDPSCGSSVVDIKNLATSALYRYTPYQPNAGALAAGYGTAHCGAYGNRNFFAYFQDWFGDITREEEKVVEAKTKFEQPIEDGKYQFISKAYLDKAIDVKGGIKTGVISNALQTYPKKTLGADNQTFEVKYDKNNGYYSIKNLAMGLAFDIKSAKTSNSTQVQIYSPHDRCNQDWLFEKDKDGYYTVVSRCSSRVLDAAPSGNVVIFDNHGGNNQKWKLIKVKEEQKSEGAKKTNQPIEDGNYQFTSKAYLDKAIDVKGGIKTGVVSNALQIYPKKTLGADNQTFEVRYDKSNGTYSIKNLAMGLAFDIKWASTANSTQVQIYSPHNECNQDWLFEKDKDGYYTITSKCSNKVLDAAPSGNIVIFDNHGGDNQKWKLTKV